MVKVFDLELTEWSSLNYSIAHWVIADASAGSDWHIRDQGSQAAGR